MIISENTFVITELHVDNQSLSEDQNLVFDPKTCSGLAKRLQVLNTSGNRMIDLCPLHELSSLTRYVLINVKQVEMYLKS